MAGSQRDGVPDDYAGGGLGGFTLYYRLYDFRISRVLGQGDGFAVLLGHRYSMGLKICLSVGDHNHRPKPCLQKQNCILPLKSLY